MHTLMLRCVLLVACFGFASAALAGRVLGLPLIHLSAASGGIMKNTIGIYEICRTTNTVGEYYRYSPSTAVGAPAGSLDGQLAEDGVQASNSWLHMNFYNMSSRPQPIRIRVKSSKVSSWWRSPTTPGVLLSPVFTAGENVESFVIGGNAYSSISWMSSCNRDKCFLGIPGGRMYIGTEFIPTAVPPSQSSVCQGINVDMQIQIEIDDDRGAITGRWEMHYTRSNGLSDLIAGTLPGEMMNAGRAF